MSRFHEVNTVCAAALGLIMFTALSAVGFAQTTKVHGMIKARSGATMVVQAADSSTVVVLLTDQTQTGQIQGLLKVRRKEMSMAALIPGLEVDVEGTYNGEKQLVASIVKFQGNDLERAQSVQAGLHETQVQGERNREDLAKQNAELQAQKDALRAEQEKVAANQKTIAEHDEKLAANQARIDAAIARFGQLDDYYILDEVTVYFGNGKVDVAPQFKPQLVQLAHKAKPIDGYMVQVTGYASSSGSAALNQKLSEDRSAKVTQILMQDGDIPLTRLLAPGAMGESRSAGDEKSAEGQAQNRRVVVRVLQNKGIAGLKSMK